MGCSGLFTRDTNGLKSNRSQLCRYFTEICLIDMLQAAAYEPPGKISPFVGAFVDELCGCHGHVLIIEVYIKYANLVNIIFQAVSSSE